MKCEKCGKETGEGWKKLCDDCFRKKDIVTMEQAAKEGARLMAICKIELEEALGRSLKDNETPMLDTVYIQAARRLWSGGRA